MGVFTDVVAGNATLATDINQYADRFNGTTAIASPLTPVAPNNSTNVLNATMPSAPASDQPVLGALVNADANLRVAFYLRGSDGYGGIRGGAGPSITAHLYAQAGGWKIDEALTIAGALNVSGGTTAAAVAASSLSVSGTATVGGANIITEGAHSNAGQPTMSAGNGVPATLTAYEIYFQLS